MDGPRAFLDSLRGAFRRLVVELSNITLKHRAPSAHKPPKGTSYLLIKPERRADLAIHRPPLGAGVSLARGG